MGGDAMATADNVAVVRRAVEAIWNRGELAVADEVFAPDYVNYGGLIPDLIPGPEAIKIGVALYRTAFPALHITVEELTADGEMVVLRWTAHRTPPGESAGLAAGGTADSMTGTTRSQVVGGKIVASWTDWDQLGVLRQLGLIPAERAPAPDGDTAPDDCSGGVS